MRTNRETHPEHRHFMQKSSKNGIVPVIMVVLFVVLLLVCYTWVLQHSYSRNRLDTAVERNIIRMDSINDSLSGVLRDEDFTSIQTIEDMDTEAYIRLQNELDQMRKQNYSYAGVIESLSGAPFDVRFLSFDDIRGNPSVLDDIDVIINVGDGDTAHTGGAEWEDPAVSSAVRKFVYNGGGLIGVGESSGHQYQGHYLQLASVLGVEKETGFTLNYDKYNWEPHPDHFILADCAGDVDFGEGKKNIYALEARKSSFRGIRKYSWRQMPSATDAASIFPVCPTPSRTAAFSTVPFCGHPMAKHSCISGFPPTATRKSMPL